MRLQQTLCSLALATLCVDSALAACLNRQNTGVAISTPTAAFSVRGDGTVVDPRTGLMWMRCLLGETLDGNGRCTGTRTILPWADALRAAQGLTFAGHSDWRLPNPKEAMSIMEDRCATPALNADLFPITTFATWTATPAPFLLNGGFDDAWVVDENGGMLTASKYSSIPMLLVRIAR